MHEAKMPRGLLTAKIHIYIYTSGRLIMKQQKSKWHDIDDVFITRRYFYISTRRGATLRRTAVSSAVAPMLTILIACVSCISAISQHVSKKFVENADMNHRRDIVIAAARRYREAVISRQCRNANLA